MMQFITLRQAQEDQGGTVTVDRHWYLTEDKTRVVHEGHPDSRWLWASPGTAVSLAEAIRLGAVKVEEPEVAEAGKEPAEKELAETEPEAEQDKSEADAKPATKARKQAPNKAAAKGEDK